MISEGSGMCNLVASTTRACTWMNSPRQFFVFAHSVISHRKRLFRDERLSNITTAPFTSSPVQSTRNKNLHRKSEAKKGIKAHCEAAVNSHTNTTAQLP